MHLGLPACLTRALSASRGGGRRPRQTLLRTCRHGAKIDKLLHNKTLGKQLRQHRAGQSDPSKRIIESEPQDTAFDTDVTAKASTTCSRARSTPQCFSTAATCWGVCESVLGEPFWSAEFQQVFVNVVLHTITNERGVGVAIGLLLAGSKAFA